MLLVSSLVADESTMPTIGRARIGPSFGIGYETGGAAWYHAVLGRAPESTQSRPNGLTR